MPEVIPQREAYMDFADAIQAHAKRVAELKDHAATEEATKMALITPFLKLLGYDPFDPRVVIPEYCADFGNKKECKVDYAIKRGDDIIIIVEAKKAGDTLDGAKEGQLQRYFQSILPVKIAILTDGIQYKFFTDLDHPNVMDQKPFMTFDFSAVDDALIPEMKKLCSECFDLNTALSAAQELKYLGLLKKVVMAEMTTPSDDLVRFFAKQVYDGMLTAKALEEFKPRVKNALANYINEVINARLQGAMQPPAYDIQPATQDPETPAEQKDSPEDRKTLTQEEFEGYHIVRAIMSEVVDPNRVALRDTINYCGILLDDKNTRPICRLHFNAASVKYIETFDAEKHGTRHKIEGLNDIYSLGDALRATAGFYGAP
jgi:hypothetical protein